MRKNPYNQDSGFRLTGGSKTGVRLKILLVKHSDGRGGYHEGNFDREVTETLRLTPTYVPIELDVENIMPNPWYPAPFGPEHQVLVTGSEWAAIGAWNAFLGVPTGPGGAAA